MKNVLEWLEATSQRLPDKAAVADDQTSLTFAELRERAQQLGTWLAARMEPRQAVALYLERTPETLAAMLGSVYAGGFYAVIDVRHPAARVQAICETLQPAVVLTDATHAEAASTAFAGSPWAPIRIEEIPAVEPDHAMLAQRREQALDIDPLYVNFTSGSTGTPKGVVVCHRSVIDFVPVFVEAMGITEKDIHANQAPFDFDVSVKDIYPALCCGSTVQIVPRPYFVNPTQLVDYLAERACTTLTWAVGAMSFVAVMDAFGYRVPATIDKVLFSGEVMPPKLLRYWMSHLPHASYVNLYGPTEVTCNCTFYPVERPFADDEVIPIGRPFANERVMLLDEHDQLVIAPDTQGEICVSGTALALGYLNDPERTAASFVPSPINGRWRETIYRTGDLAHLDAEGNLVYDGRKDHQIKHLGQRIELGEIEAAALGVEGVSQACALYDERRKKIRLFYAGPAEKDEVLAHLREILPSFMVPNTTRRMEQLPLTKNGKIDRKALSQTRRSRNR